MRYASKVAMCRVQIPKLAYDNNTLEFWYTGNGSATFDPGITTSKSTTIIWQTTDGQLTTTTGTSHAFSYTPASGGSYRCTARVAGGLGLVTAIDANADSLTALKNVARTKITSYTVRDNTALISFLWEIPYAVSITAYSTIFEGSLAQINRSATYIWLTAAVGRVTGALSDIPATAQTVCLYLNANISPASIAHLTAIRDIRIYSMGWSAAQNTTVLLSAWNARATYTYASNIALKIAAPTGTPGTEPPAEGVSNDDWSWNAGTSRHDPLTGYAVIGDLQTDFYSEGFNPWVVTIV